MRRLLLPLLLLAAVALGAQPAPAATSVTVSITSRGFLPHSFTLDYGGRVTWKNADKTNHQVVANDGSFVTPVLRPGRAYTLTFTHAGTFHYHDALRPRFTGVLTVNGPPPSLTLALDQPIVTYGTQILLSGKASNVRVGTTVTLFAQEWGQPSPVQLAVVQSGADGSFGFQTTPSEYTRYTASFETTPAGPVVGSNPVIVQVAPQVHLVAGRKGFMRAQVTAGRSFFQRHVFLQRRSAFGQWVNLAPLKLDRYSGRVFRATNFIPRGLSRIRVALSVNQAGIGLLGAHSGTQVVRH